MKKLILSSLSIFMLSSITIAQTTSDAYLFSNKQLGGTARYNGLSGAFGALGGDLTSVSENPAASAVFNSSYGSVTLAQGRSNYTTSYFGTERETSDSSFNFDQIGAVLTLDNGNSNSSVRKVALSFNYNKTNDFDAQYSIVGSPDNTIGNFFVGQANGIPNGDLSILNGETLEGRYLDIGGIYGATGQQAFLAYQAFLINPAFEGDNIINYVSNSDGSVTSQDNLVISSGSAAKMSFNLAVAYNSGLHLGGNLNLHTLNKDEQVSFIERNNHASLNYNIYEETTGAGFSADFGLIYKTENNLRFGLVYQTPTYYNISTTIDQYIDVVFENTEFFEEAGITLEEGGLLVDPLIAYEQELYTLQTPGKLAASIAYVFGNNGLLSFEYNTQDFSNMKYGSGFSGATETNSLIEETYQRVYTYKIGAEIRNQNWSFRGGLSKSTTPYKDDDFGGDSKGYSLGAGYDWGKYKLDLAYNYLRLKTAETTFENNLYTNTANIEEDRSLLTATFAVNF